MSRATRFVALATGAGLASAFLAYAADVRVSIQTVSPTYNGTSVVFRKSGRVGNWLGTTVVMDANINVGAASDYLTNIFTFSTPSLTPALTLISLTAQAVLIGRKAELREGFGRALSLHPHLSE